VGQFGGMSISYVFAAIVAFWMGPALGLAVGNFVFLLFTAVLTALELAGLLDWSWWWIALPLWAFIGGVCGQKWVENRGI
jgi:hypothetical protein